MRLDALDDINGLQRMLDFHMQRHGVLAGNLANADTPGYQPHDLVLQGWEGGGVTALAQTQPQHFGNGRGGGAVAGGGEVFDVTPSPALDENGVQVEHTLAQVTANRLRYETAVELTRRRFGLLRYAATDGSSQA